MAGVSTPALAAAVLQAGGLGSIAIGATTVDQAAAMIDDLRARTDHSFNINAFVHAPRTADPVTESAWLEALTPEFTRVGAKPPARLRAIYTSFAEDDAMLALLVDRAPAIVSLHFGLPSSDRIAALKQAGCTLFATATNLAEAEVAATAGIDAIVAQGYEAGGHRGCFDPDAHDDQLGTVAVVRLLVRWGKLPIIAAGGIMDGAGIAAMLKLGAVAAQLGTAFVACPESSADPAYRAKLLSPDAHHTRMTRAISGRPARCLPNAFTTWGEARRDATPPAYPIAYDAGKALNAAAKAAGEDGYGAHWAGQGAPLARSLPAADLMAALIRELEDA